MKKFFLNSVLNRPVFMLWDQFHAEISVHLYCRVIKIFFVVPSGLLVSLEFRRMRGDLIETYKMLNGMDRIEVERLFSLRKDS